MKITAADGRRLDAVVVGDTGPAVVFHHGTPGVGWDHAPAVAAARDRGLRWISVSRPGYGGSDRQPGRTVSSVAADVTAVLDQAGVERFIAVGWSGGGPHALACGALLAPRCAAVGLLAGVAPFAGPEAEGLDFLAGMGPENHAEFGAAVAGEPALLRYLQAPCAELAGITGEQVSGSLGGLIDAPDRAVLTGEYAEQVASSFRAAVAPGPGGWLDDDLAFVRPWGFALADVRVPVSLWQGEDDRMVPYAHGSFLAERLPRVSAHLLPGEGHLTISVGKLADVLAEAASHL